MLRVASICLLLLVAGIDQSGAREEVSLRYDVTLAGIRIGAGSWSIQISKGGYAAKAQAELSGILAFFTGFHAEGGVVGQINTALEPIQYSMTSFVSGKEEAVRLSLARGNISSMSVEPPPPPDSDRIPLGEGDLHRATDPMTAMFLLPPKSAGDLFSATSCEAGAEVFGGRMRYRLKFAFSRIEAISIPGYAGQVLVCELNFSPVSGYNPDKPVVKYLSHLRKAEIWFAPIQGSRVLVPIKLILPTPFGRAIVEADRFETSVIEDEAKIGRLSFRGSGVRN